MFTLIGGFNLIKTKDESIMKGFFSKTFHSILVIMKQFFRLKKLPNPWQKSIGIAICTGVPMLLGLIFNQAHWSALGGLGSFAYLYVTNETYYRRAKKMFCVVIGFTLTVFLGTLVAPYPFLVVILLGLIGVLATFLFGVLRIPGPAAIFFVLVYLMITSMPYDQGAAFERSFIVFLSSSFSWFVSMIVAPFDSHGPETRVLRATFMSLADFSFAMGTKDVNSIRNRVVNHMMESEEMLLTAITPWKQSIVRKKLLLLYEKANLLFIELLDLSYDKDIIIPEDICFIIKSIANEIKLKTMKGNEIALNSKPKLDIAKKIKVMTKEERLKFKRLIEIIDEIEHIMNSQLQDTNLELKKRKRSKKIVLREAFKNESIVFNKAIRYGVILAIASIVSHLVPFYKPYWIPLSCASVMLGATIIGTLNRAIERLIGTFIGLGLAAVVLGLQPKGYELIIMSMFLSAITEFIILKNYAIATIFITANAILMAESKAPLIAPEVFLSARFINVIIGSAIGLVGTFIMGHHSASIRLKSMLLKLMKNQVLVLEELICNKKDKKHLNVIIEKMDINLTNLKLAYTTALGEIGGNRENVEELSSFVYSLEYISYLLEQNYLMRGNTESITKDATALLHIYRTMISSIERNEQYQPNKLPILHEIPKLCNEVNILQEILCNSKRNAFF